MKAPFPALTRIRRPPRRGRCTADCWASRPPHARPSTSTFSDPRASTSRPATHARAGRRGAGGMGGVANGGRRARAFTGGIAEPFAPAVPPGARTLLREGEPLCRIGRVLRVREIACLRIARWVQDTLDVPGRAENELRRAPQQLRGGITPLPRGDVVGNAGGGEGVQLHPRQSYARANRPEA